MARTRDTIVAVSSPAGAGLRSIVRLSGPRAFELAGSVFRSDPDASTVDSREPYVCLGGRVSVRGGERSDDESPGFHALLFRMPGPASFTRDDVAELHLPGSPLLVEDVLEALVRAGARPAESGEFTRRAVESGRIDLVQAEAVMKLIGAADEARRRLALSELSGRWSTEIDEIRRRLLDILVRIEGNIDFAEEDADLQETEPLALALDEATDALRRMAGRRDEAALHDEPTCALLGPPNAGKSMLFNRLAEEGRSVVTEVAGTTRDYVEGRLRGCDRSVRLFDTAGAAEAHDAIEAGSQRRMRHLARGADLVCFVLDGSAPMPENVGGKLRELTQSPAVVVVNKSDLPQAFTLDDVRERFGEVETFRVCARTGRGATELRRHIAGLLSDRAGAGGAELTLRQRGLVDRALEAATRARGLLNAEAGFELMAVEVRDAAEGLRELSEPIRGDDVLDRIFSEFCIGK
jgi:tRNA modification GTPase